ncbi:MAG: GGDEF domain-containing protein, partial [Limnochordia bacterium]|nr:GGDEF domain-containing protein [Limnochordia bacterium]
MSEPITLDRLEGHLTFFSKMYDAVRIVDPVRKRVMECRGNAVDQTEEICYEYWKDRRICENCISVRAYHNDKSFMKLEQSPDAIIMVTALPIQTKEQPAVLELMKNATDSMMIGTGNYSDGRLMRNIVSDINHLVITDQLTSLYNCVCQHKS